MIIIGLTGTIGSGKTTFADFLAEHFSRAAHMESWQLIAEVAEALRATNACPAPDDITAINHWLEPLPDIISRICRKQADFKDLKLDEGVNRAAAEYAKLFQYLELVRERPELAVGPIDENRKEQLRSILQWLGGYLPAVCGGDIWYAEIIRRIKADPELELATIGGVRFLADADCVRAAGGFIIAIDRTDWVSRDTGDPTERERSRIPTDSVVHNDGSLAQLQACSRRVATDLRRDRLAPAYRASGL